MAIEYNGVNHFAISVADLEESIEWYSRVWGFTVIDKSEIPGENTKVAHLQGKGFILEIFEAAGSDPLPEYRRLPNEDLKVQGNKHISFGVPDGPQAKEELIKYGVDIVFIAEVDNTWGCFIHDNSGNLIEVFEEKGDSPFNQHKSFPGAISSQELQDSSQKLQSTPREQQDTLAEKHDTSQKLQDGEKNRLLFFQQKKTLDTFLEHGAISKAQYDKSLHDLSEKMGIEAE